MKNGRMQAKDIDDRQFLHVVNELAYDRLPQKYGSPSAYDGPHWVMFWDVAINLGDLPTKLVLAKAATLIDRGLLDGCPCGCRGDFELTTKGEELLRSTQEPSDGGPDDLYKNSTGKDY